MTFPLRGQRPARLRYAVWPAAVYAVGDVHGCLVALAELEQMILADAAAAQRSGETWIVMLGDYIDRGPESEAVIAHLLEPPPDGFRRVCLRGNHEQMMLDFLNDPDTHAYWLDEGGIETLASYGVDIGSTASPEGFLDEIAAGVPRRHLDFIATLPILLELPGWLFVHAGVRPGVALEKQEDEDLIWIREPFLMGRGLPGYRVVHGHTPVPEPEVTRTRIGIDTHCFLTGRLTAVRITPDGGTTLLTTQP